MYMRYVLNYYVLNIIFLDDKLCDSLFTVIKIDNDDDIPHETNIGKQQEIHINKVIIVFWDNFPWHLLSSETIKVTSIPLNSVFVHLHVKF